MNGKKTEYTLTNIPIATIKRTNVNTRNMSGFCLEINIWRTTDIAVCERMSIAISAFFAFYFESFAAGDAADIFSGIQCIAVVARDEIGSASFSPRYSVSFVGYRPEKIIERQSDKRRQKRNQQDADDLQTETICPVDDIFGHSDDSDYPQKNQEDSEDIYPERNTVSTE